MQERTSAGETGAGETGAGSPPGAAPGPVASWHDVTGYVDYIGRYIVLRELGRGGMGVTYVAYDEVLDRNVAIKLVRAGAMDEQAHTRLQREARALARLAHPNIVAVHDVGVHESQAFIAMELVRGQTVNAWLAAQPRSWTDVL
jgi:serine/threonine protein kinase